MNINDTTLPPPRLWGLDPMYRCNVKLFISQILQLNQVEGFAGTLVFVLLFFSLNSSLNNELEFGRKV